MDRLAVIAQLRADYMDIYKIRKSHVYYGDEDVKGLSAVLSQALSLMATEIINLEALEWLDTEDKGGLNHE